MWKIKHIFDGEYGCEALAPGEKPKVSVTLVNENGGETRKSVEDDWLTEHGLDVGSEWPEFFTLNEKGYFRKDNVDIMAFSDFYPAGHQSGITVIMNGRRLFANGDVRFEPTPGQWQPVPKQERRSEDREGNRIATVLSYPDPETHLHGFNPIIYPDFSFRYEVVAEGTETGVEVTVNLDRPVEEPFLGKLCFNLELFPGELFGKSYLCDGECGIFPRQPNGPTKACRSNYEHTGKLKPLSIARADREKLAGGNREYNPIVADDIVAKPYAAGRSITVCPEDSERRCTVRSKSGTISLYDGRMNHNNGWFVLSEEIPAGATRGAIRWTITPATDASVRREPVVQVSALGYHPEENKTAVIELDPMTEEICPAVLYKIEENGPKPVRSEIPAEWGEFLRYRYLTWDFSDIREEGIYRISYGNANSNLFLIRKDLYDRGVWQPVLEYFLPVQMCHMRVSDKYRVWHGRCHHDDARMAPVDYEQFDGAAQGPDTLTSYKSGEHVPGLSAGGWHDAGDFDLRIESQTGEMYLLAAAYEEFRIFWDETTIDQDRQIVEIHQPDGKNDILQQIEHGALSVVGGYRSLGRFYHEIMAGNLRQYVLLGDPSVMTDGTSDSENERLVFTEDNPPKELLMASHLAGSARALTDLNPELAKECLAIAERIFETTEKHEINVVKNDYDPGESKKDFYLEHKVRAACELLITTGKEQYASFITEHTEFICERISDLGWIVCRALPYLHEEAFLRDVKKALTMLGQKYAEESRKTPYGIPYRPNIWGAGWAIQARGMQYYFLHKAFPEIFPVEMLFRSLQFVLGCHPGSNTESFASGVGSRSATAAYGMNRADWSNIPGGVISGTALIRPDFPELLEFPFLWQQSEYVIGGGSSNYMFLVLAVKQVCGETDRR